MIAEIRNIFDEVQRFVDATKVRVTLNKMEDKRKL
jgi:hypothetical protein